MTFIVKLVVIGADEVVGGPVGGADESGLVRDHVLVVVDACERDAGLLRREGGNLETSNRACEIRFIKY